MTTWIFRRLIQAVFVVLAMTVIVFLGVHVIGDPVEILISPQADQAERARADRACSAWTSRCGSNTPISCGARCTATSAAASCSTSRRCG